MRTPGPWRLPRVSDSPVLVWGLGTRFPNKFPGAGTRPVWGFPLRTAALVSGWGRGKGVGRISVSALFPDFPQCLHLKQPAASVRPSLLSRTLLECKWKERASSS